MSVQLQAKVLSVFSPNIWLTPRDVARLAEIDDAYRVLPKLAASGRLMRTGASSNRKYALPGSTGGETKLTGKFKWIDATQQLPDDETTVLIALDDGEVWTGYHEGDQWFYVSSDPLGARVLYWMDLPEPPTSMLRYPDGPK